MISCTFYWFHLIFVILLAQVNLAWLKQSETTHYILSDLVWECSLYICIPEIIKYMVSQCEKFKFNDNGRGGVRRWWGCSSIWRVQIICLIHHIFWQFTIIWAILLLQKKYFVKALQGYRPDIAKGTEGQENTL